jgi:hypothetical protein
VGQHLRRRPGLDDPAGLHHRNAVADAFDHRHVVADEQERHPLARLHIGHQVGHLPRDRHIQRRHRFVRHDQRGLHATARGRCTGAGAARRKLVGIAVGSTGFEPDLGQQSNCHIARHPAGGSGPRCGQVR